MGAGTRWGLLTLALLAKPTLAQEGQGATSVQFPVQYQIDATPCAGELIDVTGTLHIVNHFVLQEDGTYHANSHFNLAGVKGIGLTTGKMYVIPSSGASVENFVQSGQIVSGTVDISLVIGKGQFPDQVGFSRVHYILGPEGEIKVENATFHFQCHE